MAITIGALLSLSIVWHRNIIVGWPSNLAATALGLLCIGQGITALREKPVITPEPFGPEPVAASRLFRAWLHQNRLRLAIVVVIVGGGLGLSEWVRRERQAFTEREKIVAHDRWVARQDLEALGGSVNSEVIDGPILGILLQRADALTRMLQSEQITKREIVDDDVKIIARFPSLERLGISSTEITDAGLRLLPPLSRLISFSVECPKVTEEGLVTIREMNRLEHLDLSGTGIRNLSGFQLEEKKVLTSLNLSSTPLTSEALSVLRSVTSLTTLDLSETMVDDRCFEYLKELQNLEELRLDGTRVSDDGIVNLKSLSKLATLSAAETKVSKQGASELKSRLPKCKVILNWSAGPGVISFPIE